jgi:hypothetical protein
LPHTGRLVDPAVPQEQLLPHPEGARLEEHLEEPVDAEASLHSAR